VLTPKCKYIDYWGIKAGMFTKACFDELGGKCLLDKKGSEVFTKQKFAWDCLELRDQADAQNIFRLFHCIFLLFFACMFI